MMESPMVKFKSCFAKLGFLMSTCLSTCLSVLGCDVKLLTMAAKGLETPTNSRALSFPIPVKGPL